MTLTWRWRGGMSYLDFASRGAQAGVQLSGEHGVGQLGVVVAHSARAAHHAGAVAAQRPAGLTQVKGRKLKLDAKLESS